MVRTTVDAAIDVEMEDTKKRTRSDGGKDSPVEVEVLSVSKKPNTGTTPVAEIVVKSQLDLYKGSLEYEEKEVLRRPAEQDQQLFLGTCGNVRGLMEEILQLKTKQGDTMAEEVEECRVKAMMQILNMRKLSRTQKVRVRMARESALEARHNVDGVTLQLQGLLYEVLHLQKEAQRCLLAHTADKEIDLLPLEQFYEQAPQTISRPEVTLDDPHQQRLARLHWELEQRRGQTTLSEQLTEDQLKVQQEILQHQSRLTQLKPRITAILQSTVPLQEALDLPLAAQKLQQETALLLPMPLYTLWMQTSAYSEAGDPLVSSIIRGDADAALKLKKQEQEAATAAVAAAAAAATAATQAVEAEEGDGADSDNDENSNDQQHQSRERGSNKGGSSNGAATAAVAVVDPIKQLLLLHPLHVEVTISVKDGSSVMLQFHYATALRFITCKCLVIAKGKQTLPGAVVMTDVLGGGDFLDCLFPEDSGYFSPNPATAHQLRRYIASYGRALPPAGEPPVIPPEVGRAYRWAQMLGGLSFPDPKQGEPGAEGQMLAEMAQDLDAHTKLTESVSTEVSSERVHVTLSAIRRRLASRLALQKHLLTLQGANSTSCIPIPSSSVPELFPGKVCSELQSWRPVTWLIYSSNPCTAAIRSSGMAIDRCLYFKAVYQRRHVDMVAYVCVFPDYPQTVPLFALDMRWGDQSCPYAHVQQLEAEVNVHWDELVSSGTDRTQVLPLMLYRLAVCLDVYTEAASNRLAENEAATLTDTQHFHKEKIFFRPARGPDRAFPLKYLSKLRVFSQR